MAGLRERSAHAAVAVLGTVAGLAVLALMSAQREAARLRGMLTNRDSFRS